MSDGPIPVKVDPLLVPLLPKFLERCRQTAVEFQQVARTGDFAGASRIGHSLHGTASSFGFHEMAEIGREIERAARSADAAALKALAERLDVHVARVRPVFD